MRGVRGVRGVSGGEVGGASGGEVSTAGGGEERGAGVEPGASAATASCSCTNKEGRGDEGCAEAGGEQVGGRGGEDKKKLCVQQQRVLRTF